MNDWFRQNGSAGRFHLWRTESVMSACGGKRGRPTTAAYERAPVPLPLDHLCRRCLAVSASERKRKERLR